MRINYFREMRNHHLVVTAGESLCADYQMKMIRKNEIKGLICPAMRQIDGETEYDYLITGCQSLQTFVETEPISAKLLSILVSGLCAILDELDRYLLDGEYLTLRPEYIYLERLGEQITGVKYCIFPFQSRSPEEQIRELFKYVINEVDYQNQEAVQLAYDLFQAASQESVDLSELSRLVGDRSCGGDSAEESVKKSGGGSNRERNKDECNKNEHNREERDNNREAEDVEIEDRLPQKRLAGPEREALERTLSEEILWTDDNRKEKIKNRKPADRKLTGKCEIALPESRKKSILRIIGRR